MLDRASFVVNAGAPVGVVKWAALVVTHDRYFIERFAESYSQSSIGG